MATLSEFFFLNLIRLAKGNTLSSCPKDETGLISKRICLVMEFST